MLVGMKSRYCCVLQTVEPGCKDVPLLDNFDTYQKTLLITGKVGKEKNLKSKNYSK